MRPLCRAVVLRSPSDGRGAKQRSENSKDANEKKDENTVICNLEADREAEK